MASSSRHGGDCGSYRSPHEPVPCSFGSRRGCRHRRPRSALGLAEGFARRALLRHTAVEGFSPQSLTLIPGLHAALVFGPGRYFFENFLCDIVCEQSIKRACSFVLSVTST